MFNKPFIGINADFRPARQELPAYSFIAAGYYDCIAAAGGIPLILPPLESDDDISSVLDSIQGMVFVGGHDLDPRRDGFLLHSSVRTLDNRRETFDRRFMKAVCQRRMPVFGVGVGMQLLNVSMGGNLFLNILEDLPTAIPHKDTQDPNHRHSLEVTPGTLMERVYGDGEIRVNSMHHMAVDEIAPGFVASARCPDGVVEAIESQMEDWFALGTQFHPEADSASAIDIRIFEEFIEGATQQSRSLRMVA